LSPFPFSLEQHRLQLDQLLQPHNDQVRVSLQRQVDIQNATLLNRLIMDKLIQKNEEVASLHIELQRNQLDRVQLMEFAVDTYLVNQSLIGMLPPVQQETNSHVSSNDLNAPGSGDEASSVARTTVSLIACPICSAVKDGAIQARFG
ncbi:hypothetical protein BAE44_0003730, partial [Dichanthelium oligosanthes]